MVPQAETSVGKRPAHQVFPIRAVDVDATLVGIHARAAVDPLFEAFQSEYAREYQVLFRRDTVPADSRIFSLSENASNGSAVADLLPDAMDARWGFEGALSIPAAEAGCR